MIAEGTIQIADGFRVDDVNTALNQIEIAAQKNRHYASKQFDEIAAWQRETFGQSTALSKIEHLKEEIEELRIDLAIDGLGKHLEFADCFILLFGAADASGMTYEDIMNAIDEKMAINRSRKWGDPDANGVVKHVK